MAPVSVYIVTVPVSHWKESWIAAWEMKWKSAWVQQLLFYHLYICALTQRSGILSRLPHANTIQLNFLCMGFHPQEILTWIIIANIHCTYTRGWGYMVVRSWIHQLDSLITTHNHHQNYNTDNGYIGIQTYNSYHLTLNYIVKQY